MNAWLVGVGKRRTTSAGGTGTRTRVVTYIPPPMTKTLAQTKNANVNKLNIRWTGEFGGLINATWITRRFFRKMGGSTP